MKSLIKLKMQNRLSVIIDQNTSIKVEDTIYWNTKSGVYIKIDSTREQIYREIAKKHN
jgi:hypothetical protein